MDMRDPLFVRIPGVPSVEAPGILRLRLYLRFLRDLQPGALALFRQIGRPTLIRKLLRLFAPEMILELLFLTT
jgi:hypothetical protein